MPRTTTTKPFYIQLTTENGKPVFINAEQICSLGPQLNVEGQVFTRIFLVTGNYEVKESPEQILAKLGAEVAR